jgi:hypothetical protein
MISVNALMKRKSGFRVNQWIMDSGAFSQIVNHGKHVLEPDQYLEYICKFSECGEMVAAVCQDLMCEPFILEKTGLTIEKHQELTMESYCYLRQFSATPILPVLQGFSPQDYVKHVRMYGEHLAPGARVGLGSVCKRNGNPDAIEDVLLAIKRERPDLLIHGFGLKVQALQRATIRSLLYSSDSMAWSYSGRKKGDAHDPRQALIYAAQIQEVIKHPVFIQEQLAQWWS